MAGFIDPNDPFYRPLWRRIVITVLPLAWGVFEFATASPFWGILFVGFAAFSAWVFFLSPEATRFAERGEGEGDAPPEEDR